MTVKGVRVFAAVNKRYDIRNILANKDVNGKGKKRLQNIR